MDEETYTTGQAARILDAGNRYVRKLITSGELEAVRDDGGRYRIPQRAVHALLEARKAEDPSPSATDISGEPRETAQELRELRQRVEDLQRELGRLEGRLELSAEAESSLRDSLHQQRQRADALEIENHQLRGQLEESKAQLEGVRLAQGARQLRASLEEPREKPEEPRRSWWRRFFGIG